MTQCQIQTADLVAFLQNGSKIQNKDIPLLDDIQKLMAKDLGDILLTHSERVGGTKADLVLKVYALLMPQVLLANTNSKGNEQVLSTEDQDQGQIKEDFKYDVIMRKISASDGQAISNIYQKWERIM